MDTTADAATADTMVDDAVQTTGDGEGDTGYTMTANATVGTHRQSASQPARKQTSKQAPCAIGHHMGIVCALAQISQVHFSPYHAMRILCPKATPGGAASHGHVAWLWAVVGHVQPICKCIATCTS